MEYYWKTLSKDSLGVSLKFRQLLKNEYFSEEKLNRDPFKNMEEEIDNYSLRMWLKRSSKMDIIIKSFKEIGLPINFTFLNYAFYNEDNELTMKENFHRDGKFTIIKGYELIKHMNFIQKVREDYNSKIELIEDYRIDWKKTKGDLIRIKMHKNVDPKKLYEVLKHYRHIFRIIIVPMYKEKEYYFFDCLDTHTGSRFSLQIFKKEILVNLKPDSCGNLIFRLITNLQTHITPEISLEIDNQEITILN